MSWQHNADKKFRSPDVIPSVGEESRWTTEAVHRARCPRPEVRVGGESLLGGMDRLDVGTSLRVIGLQPGERVIVTDCTHYGPGYIVGSVTPDPEGLWQVLFDNGYEWAFPLTALRKVYEL